MYIVLFLLLVFYLHEEENETQNCLTCKHGLEKERGYGSEESGVQIPTYKATNAKVDWVSWSVAAPSGKKSLVRVSMLGGWIF